jgi:hypothetical protein
MNSLFPAGASARALARVFVTAVVSFALVTGPAFAVPMSVGDAEQIYTKSKRSSKGLKYWPDGNFGVVSLGNGMYDFYAANSSKSVKTTGTLTDPGKSKKSVKITDLPKKTFNYVAGGPVYEDPGSGARLMIYHAEKHGKSAKDFYSVLGLAVSTDPAGRQFRDLGVVIEPHLQVGQTEVGGGPFAVFDGYLHVYYRDWFPHGQTSELTVARAPLAELVSNALAGRSTEFMKYHNGGFTQPGKGGLSHYLEEGNPSNAWTAVSYNEYLDQLVMVSSQWTADKPDLYLATSADGIHWSPRQPVALDPGEQFYPTIIGTGDDPQRTGQSFYVYYTDSKKGAWSRWSDAKLMRREITFDPAAQPAFTTAITQPESQLPLVGPSTPAPGDSGIDVWSLVSDFTSDFQGISPAEGWKYAWNPTGSVSNPANFAPLAWSDSLQVYNTTGGAIPVPSGGTSHKDDYLYLSANGGHPGRPKYFSIAGYTIQADDGAGMYRIADSSIRKGDDVDSRGEDDLRVLVYINNELAGSQTVSTSGIVTGFDRELGQLNVGDTVWVMVDPLKNQNYDLFTGFDFSIQKLFSSQSLAFAASMVPEPTSGLLLVMGAALLGLRRPRRGR